MQHKKLINKKTPIRWQMKQKVCDMHSTFCGTNR